MRHRVCHGWDVLMAINGQPCTFTFPTDPTTEQLADAVDRIEREMVDAIECSQVIIKEEGTIDGL
jgi:hypothetical protein